MISLFRSFKEMEPHLTSGFQFRTYDDAVLADVNVRSYLRSVDDRILVDEDVISDVQREEGNSFAEFLERWTYHRSLADHAMPSDSNVCQVTTHNAVGLNDRLPIEDNVLTST